MTDPANPQQLDTLLREIAMASPEPWYPKLFAESHAVHRDSLDPPLERLRLAGLIRLTDWVQGKGQGYVLTPEGMAALKNSWVVARLRAGQVPARKVPEEEEPPSRRERTTFERGEAIRESLLSPSTPYATYLLIAANVLVFVAGLALAQRQNIARDYLNGNDRQLAVYNLFVQIGALRNVDLDAGQWWRLLTACFVHFGFLHILVNMVALGMIGPMLERMWGTWRYLVIYFVSGLVGSLAMSVSFVFVPNGIGAGASGAIWGMMTSMLAWVFLNRRFLPRGVASAWLRRILVVILLNAFISFMPGISAAGHFGGGAAGLVTGALLNYQRFGRMAILRFAALLIALAMPVVAFMAIPAAKRAYGDYLLRHAADPAQLEATDLRQRLRDADPIEKSAREGLDHALRLVDRNWRRRDPDEVLKAVAGLAEAREQFEKALEIIEPAGPYRTEQLETLRQREVSMLQAELRLAELAQSCLEKGEGWTDGEELELKQQRQRLRQLETQR